MGKAKTSQKRKAFSVNDMKPVSLKPGVKTIPFSPTENLANAEFIQKALLDGDSESFKEILKSHFEAVNTSKLLKSIHLSERTFYEAVSEKGNPSLKTIAKIMNGVAGPTTI